MPLANMAMEGSQVVEVRDVHIEHAHEDGNVERRGWN